MWFKFVGKQRNSYLSLFWKFHCATCVPACVTFLPRDRIVHRVFSILYNWWLHGVHALIGQMLLTLIPLGFCLKKNILIVLRLLNGF